MLLADARPAPQLRPASRRPRTVLWGQRFLLAAKVMTGTCDSGEQAGDSRDLCFSGDSGRFHTATERGTESGRCARREGVSRQLTPAALDAVTAWLS